MNPKVDAVAAQAWGLTRAQISVLLCLAHGWDAARSAVELGVGVRTVRSHRHAVFTALGARNGVHAVRIAQDAGVVRWR